MEIKVTVFLAALFYLEKGVDSFTCYSCTYTRSSDPSINYNCVTEPWNVSLGSNKIQCLSPKRCFTIVTFRTGGSKQPRSVARTCLLEQDICKGDKCCNYNGIYRTCQRKCEIDYCNDQNPEQWQFNDTSGTNSCHVITVMLACFVSLMHALV